MASCTRPSERASEKVSCNCSGLTPTTGMMSFSVPTKLPANVASFALELDSAEGVPSLIETVGDWAGAGESGDDGGTEVKGESAGSGEGFSTTELPALSA